MLVTSRGLASRGPPLPWCATCPQKRETTRIEAPTTLIVSLFFLSPPLPVLFAFPFASFISSTGDSICHRFGQLPLLLAPDRSILRHKFEPEPTASSSSAAPPISSRATSPAWWRDAAGAHATRSMRCYKGLLPELQQLDVGASSGHSPCYKGLPPELQ